MNEQAVTSKEIADAKKLSYSQIRDIAETHRNALDLKDNLDFILVSHLGAGIFKKITDEEQNSVSFNLFKIGIKNGEPYFVSIDSYSGKTRYVELNYIFDEEPNIALEENEREMSKKDAELKANQYLKEIKPNKIDGECFLQEACFVGTKKIMLENKTFETMNVFKIGFNDFKTLFISIDIYNGSVTRVSEVFCFAD